MSEGLAADTGSGLEISDEFKAFLMSHKEEVMQLLKAKTSSPGKECKEKKRSDSSSESESSMARRRRDSTSSDCSSEGEERRVVVDKKREDVSRSRSRSPSRSRDRVARHDARRDDRSESRSRSRSSTPARYARRLRNASRDHAEGGREPARIEERGRGRGYETAPRVNYSTSTRHTEERHRHHYECRESHHRPGGGAGGVTYDTGAPRRSGFIRSRNMIEDGRDDPRPSRCLGVFGMPPWVREFDLRNMFEPFGAIDQCNVVINRHTGQCRGYGFVYYMTVEEAKRARSAMRDAILDGIPIRVDYSVTDQRRPSYRDRE